MADIGQYLDTGWLLGLTIGQCINQYQFVAQDIVGHHPTAANVSAVNKLQVHLLITFQNYKYEHVLECDAHTCCIVSLSLLIIGKCQCGNNRALVPRTIKPFSPHTCMQ